MKSGGWKFDDAMALEFDSHARAHIPHYEEVVRECVSIAESALPDKLNSRIIDVGSATGYTLEQFRKVGYVQVFGVDSSPSMLARSRVEEGLIQSSRFPKENGPFDMVVANWTLHFIPERESYMRDIYESLNKNGIFILSEKMESSAFVHDRYHDFKRSMGVSEKEIKDKEASLVGVLTTRPLEWYLEKLTEAGFAHVEIIDAAWCFKTLLCTK